MRPVIASIGWCLIVLGLALLALWGARVARATLSLRDHATQLQALLERPTAADPAAVCGLVHALRADILALTGDAGGLARLAPLLGGLPRVGGELRAAPHLLAVAEGLSEVGSIGCQAFQPLLNSLGKKDAAGRSASLQSVAVLLAQHQATWPIALAVGTLAGVTVLVALVSEIFVGSVQGASVELGMTPAFVGFIIVALVGAAAEMASAFSGAWKNRLDLSVGIALGSAAQIALFVAPVLVLLSYVVGPTPMSLQFWPGAVVMMLVATMTAFLVTNSGRSAWFVGVLLVMVYLVFAMTLYLLPPMRT
jgi:hypothetical protein